MQHPEVDLTFNEAMIGYTHQVANAVTAIYDSSAFRNVVDVGGGYGTLLAAILRDNPDAAGIFFDVSHVIDAAQGFLHTTGVADHCTRITGDFFAAVPAGGDAYILSQILHDWEDEQCQWKFA